MKGPRNMSKYIELGYGKSRRILDKTKINWLEPYKKDKTAIVMDSGTWCVVSEPIELVRDKLELNEILTRDTQ